MAITIKQRAFAGLWFMAAAAFLIVPITAPFVQSAENQSELLDYLIWFLLSPLLTGGLVGALFGASILDRQRVRNGWRAALRGLFTAVIAYLLYAIVLSAWEGYANHGAFSPVEAFTRMLMMVLIWGAIFFGWAAAIIGVLAGWLLHLISASRDKRTGMR
ncbi:MAG TPA: hypothetical protein VNI02_19995 [Blastocatellia bacterium]|jgi:hypothetical protein|nr:hypothetical protein [Blastocatellia bacterium]